MNPVRCISSQLMSGLLSWRNPQGAEEGWFFGSQGIPNPEQHIAKVVTTEIGLALLATCALVETAAYSALSLASLSLYPFASSPYEYSARLLQSSSFMVIWAIADVVFCNPFYSNVFTEESFARYWAQLFNPTSLELFRTEDSLYISDWQARLREQHSGLLMMDMMLNPIVEIGRITQERIAQGATFITQEVLSGASANTLNKFKEIDTSFIMFFLTKAICIYVAGARKEEIPPDFFTPNTQALISSLRSDLQNNTLLQRLQELTQDPVQFDRLPDDEATLSAFNRLKNIAAAELQGSLFATRCWQKALAMLPNE